MITLAFKDIFKDYSEFKAFTDKFKLYEEVEETAEAFNKHIYYTLKMRYGGCAVAYDIVEEFKAEFGLAYNQYFKLYLKKQDILEKIYKLTEEDFILLNQSLNNLSNNPNYQTNDAWEVLDYISIQNRSKSTSNKLQAYLLALRTLPDAQINAMLEAFDYLWLDILDSDTEYFYNKEK